jgi:Ni,Fe-hydrogenase III large subunit
VTRPELPAVRNGQALAIDRVPRLELDDFRALVTRAPAHGSRVAALFGRPAGDGKTELFAALAVDEAGLLHLARAEVSGGEFPSMTPECPEVHLFEREIAEQLGVRPVGHPWLKPVRFAGVGEKAAGVMDFYRVHGEEVHEVAVGPVHAGVIEPGHFRFQCHGEKVFHLEISLGYQHRGVERALVGGPGKRTVHVMETLAGDTTVGHATAYCQAIEALSGCRVPARAQAIRGIALELERMANHTGNIGALAGDVGYLPTASSCGRLRGDFLNLTAELAGNRFGRGLVRPGGVAFDVPGGGGVEGIVKKLEAAIADVEATTALLNESPSVQARFEATGHVDTEVASSLGLVGVSARACGLARDVRHDFPSGIYRFAQIPVPVWHTGDVFARAHVRSREIRRSAAFVRTELRKLPKGALRAQVGALAPDRVVVSLVEGFRGEICHVAITNADGRFASYKVVDPSFHNWMGLAMALRDQQISDFPLCNKSFDLSYCGFDL